jgi:hypothetical protein
MPELLCLSSSLGARHHRLSPMSPFDALKGARLHASCPWSHSITDASSNASYNKTKKANSTDRLVVVCRRTSTCRSDKAYQESMRRWGEGGGSRHAERVKPSRRFRDRTRQAERVSGNGCILTRDVRYQQLLCCTCVFISHKCLAPFYSIL